MKGKKMRRRLIRITGLLLMYIGVFNMMVGCVDKTAEDDVNPFAKEDHATIGKLSDEDKAVQDQWEIDSTDQVEQVEKENTDKPGETLKLATDSDCEIITETTTELETRDEEEPLEQQGEELPIG